MTTTTEPLATLQTLTKDYADARATLSTRVTALRDEIDDAKRRKLPGIQTAVAAAKDAEEALAAELRKSADLFVNPRTITAHGVKIGWGKAKGKISWDDAKTVIARIKEHFPKLAPVLIKTTEKPVRKALSGLTVAELKRIGCSSTAAGDGIVIKPTDGDIEKLVTQLLKAETADEDTEE